MTTTWRSATVALGVTLAACLPACKRTSREIMVTAVNAEQGVSVRYPASWKTDQGQQDAVWYRTFQAPLTLDDRKPEVTVQLLAGPLGGTVDAYAQSYLQGHTQSSVKDDVRPGATGRSWRYASADGKTRYALTLLREQDQPRMLGLFAQGLAKNFEKHEAQLEEMFASLAVERPPVWREVRNDAFGFSIRLPASWSEQRTFSSAGTFLSVYNSPPVSADKSRQGVIASLTLTVETLPPGGTIDTFYKSSRDKLGDAFQMITHAPWQGGWQDDMRTETAMGASRVKRMYLVSGNRGASLTFEGRDDVFHRANKWCDAIAATFTMAAR